METITITRVSIPMSVEEREALRTLALAELRDPREQARYLLRQALGLTSEDVQPQQNANRVGVHQDQAHTVAA